MDAQARPCTELLTSRQSFVDAALAELYGVAFTGRRERVRGGELPAASAPACSPRPACWPCSRAATTLRCGARPVRARRALCMPKSRRRPRRCRRDQALLAADMTERERAEVREPRRSRAAAATPASTPSVCCSRATIRSAAIATHARRRADRRPASRSTGRRLDAARSPERELRAGRGRAPEFTACVGTRTCSRTRLQDDALDDARLPGRDALSASCRRPDMPTLVQRRARLAGV